MDSSTRRRRRAVSTIVAGLGVSLLLTGCGFNMQTLQPYTQAQGVNIDVPAGENNRLLKVRNLLVVADDSGLGVLSASIVSPVPDRLVGVEGNAVKADNSMGAPLTITGEPVVLESNRMAVLTDQQPGFTVTGSDLQPGFTVDLTLTFASGIEASATAPVMSADHPVYATVSPTPSATPSATPTP